MEKYLANVQRNRISTECPSNGQCPTFNYLDRPNNSLTAHERDDVMRPAPQVQENLIAIMSRPVNWPKPRAS